MMTVDWIVPFVYVAVILALYLFTPETRRPAVQANIRAGLNHLLIVGIVLIALANIAVIFAGSSWLSWLTRIALLVALVYAVRISMKRDDT